MRRSRILFHHPRNPHRRGFSSAFVASTPGRRVDILKERRTESTKALRFRHPHRHAAQFLNSS
jgi:hypothetical protein